MEKIKFNLNELKVESFETNQSKKSKGTINGQAGVTDTCIETEGPECSYQPGCDSYDCWITDTCDRQQCYGTVNFSCDCPTHFSREVVCP